MKHKRKLITGLLLLLLLAVLGYFWLSLRSEKRVSWWHNSAFQLLASLDEQRLSKGPQLNTVDLHWHSLETEALVKQWQGKALSSPSLIHVYPLVESEAGYTAVLENTTRGLYDPLITTLAEKLTESELTHQVAWMPFPAQAHRRWPWQMQKPAQYIEAYRHFYRVFRQANQRTPLVFQTTALPGVMEYHPGDQYVDYNALHLLPRREAQQPGMHRDSTLLQSFLRKRHRLRFSLKPLLVFQENADFDFKELRQAHDSVEARLRDYRQHYHNLKRRTFLPDSARGFELGLYDPKDRLNHHPAVTAEHLFLNLRALEWGPFKTDLAAVMERGHAAIVTVEPFKDAEANHDRQVLDKILAGAYDADFDALYKLLARQPQRIYLRFAHEMEIPIKRYPWQSQDPLTYILAYRYFIHHPAVFPANIRSVWGPAGDRASLDWYPGDDVVDYTSIAIYGLPEKGIEDHRKQERFPRIFERKHWRLRFAKAPLFITEFGVKGPDSYQAEWLTEAGAVLAQEDDLKGACYFNLYDNPEVWGEGMAAPDWSISESSLEAFIRSLEKN